MLETTFNQPNYGPGRNQLQYDYKLLRNKPTQECFGYLSTPQTFGATWTKIQLDVFDNLAMQSGYGIKILISGVYIINASLGLRPSGVSVGVAIYLNGVNFAINHIDQTSTNITRVILGCNKIYKLNKGDILELYGYDSSGGSDSGNDKTYLEVYQIR